jgi:hypothetical protein
MQAANAVRFLYAAKNDPDIAHLGAELKHEGPRINPQGFGPSLYSPVRMRRR